MYVKEMTGIEYVHALAAGDIALPAILKFMPISITAVESGCVRLQIIPNDEHCDFLGKVHTGYAATVLDVVIALAVRTLLDTNQSYDILDMSLKICQPLPCHEVLYAEAKIVNKGRKLVIAEGTLKDRAGHLYAYTTANHTIVKAESIG